LFGALLYLPVSLLFFYIGTALYSYYTAQPDLLPNGTPGDEVFPHFIVNGLPTGITGLLIAAIFAAGMSTISTSINSTATIVLTDYYKRYVNKNATGKSEMKVLYLSSVIFGALGVTVSLALVGVESVLDAWWSLASIFSGGMLGLFLLAFLSKKVRNIDAAIGVIIGVLVVMWMSLTPLYFTEGNLLAFKSPFHTNLTIVIGTLAIFLIGFITMKFFSGRPTKK
jgi:SSS family solute:Na+ symporter